MGGYTPFGSPGRVHLQPTGRHLDEAWYPVGRGEAFGWPGLEPRWAPGAKQGVGTACSTRSRVWFTIAEGILTEIFYPHVDTANTRDLQFLVTDGATFVHEERRDLSHTISYADPRAPPPASSPGLIHEATTSSPRSSLPIPRPTRWSCG